MKKTVSVVLMCILLAGCGSQTKSASIPVESPPPSARVIVERNVPTPTPEPTPTPKPVFDPYEVGMISTPNSTCFCEVGYSYEFEKLVVCFRNSSDRIYIHSDVPAEVWEEFIDSSSLGGYYNKQIKDYYDFERID